MKLVSIITPVLNEEANIFDYILAVENSIIRLNPDIKFELIFIDDGSRDLSWELISKAVKDKPFIKGIQLSRNMGSHYAISAGFMYAQGDAVCTLACDLQDDPMVVNQFIEEWKNGFEVVWGTREKRNDLGWKRYSSKLFEFVLRKWAMPKNSKFTTGSFLLVDKKVVQYFNSFSEQNRITFAIIAYMGFKQVNVYYSRRQRLRGESGWSLWKMIHAFYDALIAFSHVPIRINTIISVLLTLANVPFAIYVLYLYFSGRTAQIGYVSIILTFMVLGSALLLNTAVILEYLTRIYANTTNRPLYFVSNLKGFENEKA